MRKEGFLNPLFEKSMFAVACLVVFMSFTMYLLFWAVSPPPSLAPDSVEAVVPVHDHAGADDAYERGFRIGFQAFLKQTGQYTPQSAVSASYTSSESGGGRSSTVNEEEEVARGYVDGYHKATELGSCPRGL